jgi:hypothetical protein
MTVSTIDIKAAVGMKRATLGSSGKHTDHYTTEATRTLGLACRLLLAYAGTCPTSPTLDTLINYHRTLQRDKLILILGLVCSVIAHDTH